MRQTFSKIWISIILIVLIAGGNFAWQYRDWLYYYYLNYIYIPIFEALGKPISPKAVPPNWQFLKSCTKNEDCGIDICQQEKDKCVEIRYVCEMGKCIYPAKIQEFFTPPYICWKGKCESICGNGVCENEFEKFHCPQDCVEEVAPKEETTDWKTYRNEKYGFEVKYPKDWNIAGPTPLHTPQWVVMIGPPHPLALGLIIYIEEVPKEKTLKEYLKERDTKKLGKEYNLATPEIGGISEKEIEIANLPAIQREEFLIGPRHSVLATYLKKENLIFIFNFYPTVTIIEEGLRSERITDKDLKLNNKILSTFMFVEIEKDYQLENLQK